MNTATQTNTANTKPAAKGKTQVKAPAKPAPVKVTSGDIGYFTQFITGWAVDTMGPKPTPAMLGAALALGKPGKTKRPGVEALHVAMCLRAGGCTVRQFLTAGSCGPANNHRRALRTAGLVTEGKAPGQGGYAFILKLTPAGVAQCKAMGVAVGDLPRASDKVPVTATLAPKAPAKPKGVAEPKVAAPTTPKVANVPAAPPAPALALPRVVPPNDGSKPLTGEPVKA